ncbi:lysylphosphatidylglycerol synthase domain-containing protein [Actinospongicola halichondriae]|uniref:lysylphosphatidylglycerol synthase domain-containing protein n=1 Tax=Actinospongicola halichondriae TaxID=3236844 RepID=UPI003D4B38CD
MSDHVDPRPEPAATPRRRGVAVTTVLGVVFAVGGLAFVVQRIGSTWDETGPVLRDADPGWLLAALVLAAAGMTAIALPWVSVVRALGGSLTVSTAVLTYYVGEIGKYLPGGVWPVVGRGELAVRSGMRRTIAYTSVLFSLAVLYLAALLTAAGLFPIVLATGGTSSKPVLLVLLVPLGLALLHPSVLGPFIGLVGRLAKREIAVDLPSWGVMVGLVLRYVPAWLLIGSATWAVTRALSADVSWLEICLATVLSWSAGFLVAPAPGGVGIREAAFVAVAASMSGGIAAAAALCARLIFMLVDAAGAALCGVVLGARRRADGVDGVDGPVVDSV